MHPFSRFSFIVALLAFPLYWYVHYYHKPKQQQARPVISSARFVENIPLPAGFERVNTGAASFGVWLRKLSLRADNTVYLYNHQPKPDQSGHYAVLDLSTGNEDLQQCADAVMRLRAEYFFSRKEYNAINFPSGNSTWFNFQRFTNGERYRVSNEKIAAYNSGTPVKCDSHDCLMQFLRWVFIYCGTYTVAQQTTAISNFNDIQPGDVLVKAGAPGHAMIVVDVALQKNSGNKIFLLAQGYMPAQDMHIVKNNNSSTLNPWYSVEEIKDKIYTPGYVFERTDLKRWK